VFIAFFVIYAGALFLTFATLAWAGRRRAEGDRQAEEWASGRRECEATHYDCDARYGCRYAT
jgi:hypothetical protein